MSCTALQWKRWKPLLSQTFLLGHVQPKGQTFKKLSLSSVHLVYGCYLRAHTYWLLYFQSLSTFPGIDTEGTCLRGSSAVFGGTAVNSQTTWNRDPDSTLFCLLNISCSWEETVHHTESGNSRSGRGICSALTFRAFNYESMYACLYQFLHKANCLAAFSPKIGCIDENTLNQS